MTDSGDEAFVVTHDILYATWHRFSSAEQAMAEAEAARETPFWNELIQKESE